MACFKTNENVMMSNAELKVKFTKIHKMIVGLNMASVIDDLFQEEVISAADLGDLNNEKDRRQQATKLVVILHTSHHPQAFVKLREAIAREKAYSFVIQSLDEVKITKEDPVPRVVHTLPHAEGVRGVTSLDDELFVLRWKDKEQVEVYNTTTTTTTTTRELYSLVRRLSLPVVKSGLRDMTSCKHYRCLYIADDSNCCVHRVELNGKVTKLYVNNRPTRLSVTSQFTVLVTCWRESNILELTTEGKQLRAISLQSDIVHPQQVIQLSNGQFVVSHGADAHHVHRVCIVDTNGHVIQSYGGPRGSATVGQLNGPWHLAVDKDEFIFVADCNNSRVLLLSPTLSCVREIVSGDQFIWQPRRLFLDADTRLYVAVGGRVVVVQL